MRTPPAFATALRPRHEFTTGPTRSIDWQAGWEMNGARDTMAGSYYAVVEKEAESDFSVFFPDLPGCVTAGETLDEALAFAVEALGLHLEGMRAHRLPVPGGRDLAAIERDPVFLDDLAHVVAILRVAPQPMDAAA